MAVRRIAAKEIKGLIHHSDRGVQYASADYIAILRHNGILPSMTEDGNPKDNAIAERVNGIIKNELLQGMRFSSIQEVRKAVATAVHFYNNERPHMSLDMLTPVQAGEMQGPIRKRWISYRAVSYTHLDVYKRQGCLLSMNGRVKNFRSSISSNSELLWVK